MTGAQIFHEVTGAANRRRTRVRHATRVWAVICSMVGIAVVHAQGTPAAGAGRDLSGFWALTTLTPMLRPAEFADKPFFSEDEAREWLANELNNRKNSQAPEVRISPESTDTWYEFGTLLPNRRTSLVVDPPNGRIPRARPTTPVANSFDDPESRPLSERCLVWGGGPPMVPDGIFGHHQIVQTPDYVVIVNEMIHDARIVPLDGRPHLPAQIRQWSGDARGRWDGDTLVVETTNFRPENRFAGVQQGAMTVVERFRRIDAGRLFYSFTVSDPEAFSAPWTAEMEMTRMTAPIYEYACHENNYSLANVLRGARAQER
jgi:hypothetical protein